MTRLSPLLLLALLACKDDGPGDDTDVVGGDDSDAPVDADGDGFSADEDCDDDDAAVNPDAVEVCDDLDNNCNDQVDEGVLVTVYTDADGDGYGDDETAAEACQAGEGQAEQGGDCDDSDPAFHPDAVEDDCADPNDYNCDGFVGYADADGDGWAACEECDDADAAVNPDAAEVCNEVDDNCDGSVDEGVTTTYWADSDGDGYGDVDFPQEACEAPEGYADNSADCDDTEAAVNPAAQEVCNDVDDDCDGDVDDADASLDATTGSAWYADTDGDSYGDATASSWACDQPSGSVADSTDCDDGDAAVNPAAQEVCDDIDDDCDGDIDDDDSSVDASTGSTFYQDSDGDSYGDASVSVAACEAPSGYVSDRTDCDDAEPLANPGQAEACDSIDNDCDSSTDEGVTTTYYLDGDADGYGLDSSTVEACAVPSGYASAGGDCDDADAAYNPGASQGCDGNDYDCDGSVDNDGDGDGYAAESCGGDDCDDTDASIVPDANGCALGVDCLSLLADGYTTDGTYSIDPDGYGAGLDPFDVTCDMTHDGGGWTLIFHVFDMGGSSGLDEDEFISLYSHNLWTDETWSYDASSATISDGLSSDGLVQLTSQGMVAASAMDGLWDDIRMTCSQSDSDSAESSYVQVDGYATTNGSWGLLGAAANGSSYSVDATLNSEGISTVYHDNETTTQNSGHYLCDYTNSRYTSSYGGAPQFGFCYTNHLTNFNNQDYSDSIVSIAFGTYEGSDPWSPGFTLECGRMGTTAQQNAGTYSIWVR
ncbi:MAG: hypothetical protein H6741_35060 [Alphaproteobacteria bacterium]|nr:hypothetical protein [Alphaproteobacteria bacterium]MCB9797930.1 hypothetical protein [Alphaproteobacteria bacterium]